MCIYGATCPLSISDGITLLAVRRYLLHSGPCPGEENAGTDPHGGRGGGGDGRGAWGGVKVTYLPFWKVTPEDRIRREEPIIDGWIIAPPPLAEPESLGPLESLGHPLFQHSLDDLSEEEEEEEEEVTQGEEKQVALKRFIQPKSTRWLCQLGEVDLLVFVFSSDIFPSAQTLQCFRITIEELPHHFFGLTRSDTSKNIYTSKSDGSQLLPTWRSKLGETWGGLGRRWPDARNLESESCWREWQVRYLQGSIYIMGSRRRMSEERPARIVLIMALCCSTVVSPVGFKQNKKTFFLCLSPLPTTLWQISSAEILFITVRWSRNWTGLT